MYEVENSVPGWVHACNERGPSHGALRRRSSSETLEVAVSAKAVEIGQIVPVTFQKGWIHAVNTEDNDFPAAGSRMIAGTRHAQDKNERQEGSRCRGRHCASNEMENGTAFHPIRRLNSKKLQGRRRHIFDT